MQAQQNKIDFFLDLALMDKQFALVLYDTAEQMKEMHSVLRLKEKALVETENLEELKGVKTGTCLFHVQKTNIDNTMGWLKAILPTFNQYKVVAGTADASRMIFAMDKGFFSTLPAQEQEQILAAFLPIFDFANV